MGRGDHHNPLEMGSMKRPSALFMNAKAACFYNMTDQVVQKSSSIRVDTVAAMLKMMKGIRLGAIPINLNN